MMRPIQKIGTPRRGYTMLFTPGSARQVARWCRGEVCRDYPDDTYTEPVLTIKYNQGGQDKRVFVGDYLVHFGGEFFAVKYDDFKERFEFTTKPGLLRT